MATVYDNLKSNKKLIKLGAMFYSSLTAIEYSHIFLCFILEKYFRPYTHKVFKISYPHYNYVTYFPQVRQEAILQIASLRYLFHLR